MKSPATPVNINEDPSPPQLFNDRYNEDDNRPIKPKQNSIYDDVDPELEKEAKYNEAEEEEEVFPPGMHPLEGVPNLRELPSPEALNKKSK